MDKELFSEARHGGALTHGLPNTDSQGMACYRALLLLQISALLMEVL